MFCFWGAQAASLFFSAACRKALQSRSCRRQAADDCRLAARAPQTSALHARATAPGVAGVFHRPSFRLDFGNAGAAFHFHDLIAQKCGALEFQIGRGALHLFFELSAQPRCVEITTWFANDEHFAFAAATIYLEPL